MKKIEITNIITSILQKSQIEFYDLLDQPYYIDSYEKYIQVFTLTKNTFKNSILPFEEVATNYLAKMENFINQCKIMNDNEIESYINNNIYIQILEERYNRSAPLALIFPTSLTNNLEISLSTLKQVYYELGMKSLLDYIDLVKRPTRLNEYLNTSDKQSVAMHYILYKTDHHSPSRFKRNTSSSSIYNEMKQDIYNSVKEITSEKNDYINFMKKEKESINTWQEETRSDFQSFMDNCKQKVANLEKAYSEKLKIEKPAEFMLEKSKEYEKKTKSWIVIDILAAALLIGLLGIILDPTIEINKKIININLFSNEMPIYSSIIILSIVCLIIYILRIMIKITISSKHLSEEYKQKYILTYFYLSLINEGKIEEKIGQTILALLFSKADTGLIKSDNSNDFESLIKTLTLPGK